MDCQLLFYPNNRVEQISINIICRLKCLNLFPHASSNFQLSTNNPKQEPGIRQSRALVTIRIFQNVYVHKIQLGFM